MCVPTGGRTDGTLSTKASGSPSPLGKGGVMSQAGFFITKL